MGIAVGDRDQQTGEVFGEPVRVLGRISQPDLRDARNGRRLRGDRAAIVAGDEDVKLAADPRRRR